MQTPSASRVFVSHASEDKDRFVIPFATALRQRGLDAWFDKWEMLPGSLVDKNFEEGLKEAAAVLVVLSRVSKVQFGVGVSRRRRRRRFDAFQRPPYRPNALLNLLKKWRTMLAVR